jgi:hypothetical protein
LATALFLNSFWDGRLGQLPVESDSHDRYQICESQRMNDAREIHSAHPLFRVLRNGLLWHCTSPDEHLQIRVCGFIKPNKSPDGKYGRRPSACQALDGVSLFDFTSESEARVLDTPHKWQQFLGCAKPLTVILGLKKDRLLANLVSYPENRDITSQLECDGPIPWVEVCHRGQIPISAITCYLLVCAADYCRFKQLEILNEADLDQAATMCVAATRTRSEGQSNVQKINQSSEFKSLMEQVRRQAEKIRRQI